LAEYLRGVAAAVLLAVSAVALRGHIPPDVLNPLAGAIGALVALAVAAAVLAVALVVVGRPIHARLTDQPVSGPRMRTLVVVGCCLALAAEFVAVCLPDRGDAVALTGVAVGLVLLGVRGYLGVPAGPRVGDAAPDDEGESLQRWVSRTEALIHWSETTRSDWDRRVRPVLARQFEMATKVNQRRTTDPAAFQATGVMLFGADLWPWVDPDNVVRGGLAQRGPGRGTLEGILHCLEQA
jgi:hypothetical protein